MLTRKFITKSISIYTQKRFLTLIPIHNGNIDIMSPDSNHINNDNMDAFYDDNNDIMDSIHFDLCGKIKNKWSAARTRNRMRCNWRKAKELKPKIYRACSNCNAPVLQLR